MKPLKLKSSVKHNVRRQRGEDLSVMPGNAIKLKSISAAEREELRIASYQYLLP